MFDEEGTRYLDCINNVATGETELCSYYTFAVISPIYFCASNNLRYRLRSTFSCYREAFILCPTLITRKWKSGAWEEARKRQKVAQNRAMRRCISRMFVDVIGDAYEIINFKRAFKKSGATKLPLSLWRWLIMTFNARKRGFTETSLSSSRSNYEVHSWCANWKIALLTCLSLQKQTNSDDNDKIKIARWWTDLRAT